MTPDAETELHALRRRAYGPDGDIHRDPVALARLAQLEELARAGTEPTVAPAAAPVDDAPLQVVDPAAPEAGEVRETTAVAEPLRARARTPRRRSRLIAVWAASIVAALVVGAATTWGSVRLVSRASGVEQIAVLQPDPGRSLPEDLNYGDIEDVTIYQDFEGVTVITAQAPWAWSGENENCIIIAATADFDGEPGQGIGTVGNGCGAGEFAATVQLRMRDELPGTLTRRFGEGTALQFVYDGDRVAVYAGQRPTPETDAAGQ
jgi:hypothetical protein